jgi:predicted RNase H-like HicB family nuclease
MREYEITVERDGRWWMIAIPAIDGLTQAEDFDEIEAMARSYIAFATEAPIDEVAVRIVGKIEALLDEIEDLRDRLSVHERPRDTVSLEKLADDLGIER